MIPFVASIVTTAASATLLTLFFIFNIVDIVVIIVATTITGIVLSSQLFKRVQGRRSAAKVVTIIMGGRARPFASAALGWIGPRPLSVPTYLIIIVPVCVFQERSNVREVKPRGSKST